DEQHGGDQRPLDVAVQAGGGADAVAERGGGAGDRPGEPLGQRRAAQGAALGGLGRVAHALAPEYSLRRAMISRAAPLTSRVMTNSTMPEAIRASWPITLASLNLLAMFWAKVPPPVSRSEEHTSELQSRENLVCRLLLEKKKKERTH